jgi:hypothetical protein
MTKFELIRTNTGEWRLPEEINRAIATAIVSGYRVQMTEFSPGTGTGVVDVIGRADELVPNAETIEAMEAAERGEFVGKYKTVDELFEALNADD